MIPQPLQNFGGLADPLPELLNSAKLVVCNLLAERKLNICEEGAIRFEDLLQCFGRGRVLLPRSPR